MGEFLNGLPDRLRESLRDGIDRRWVFLLVLAAVIFPTLVFIPFPVPASNATRQTYDAIEALPEDAVVVVSFSYGPSSMAELQPQAKAVLRHCFRRGARVIVLSLWPDGTPLAAEALSSVVGAAEFRDADTGTSRLAAGVDYVDVGYRQGYELVILGMAEDIPEFFEADVRGEPLDALPVMAGVSTFGDVDLVFDLAAGDSTEWWVLYGHQRYGVSVAYGVTGVIVSQLFPYLDSGQIVGLIAGGVGAAEYEALVSAPGDATRRVSTLSYVHFLVIALIVVGNVIYFRARRASTGEAVQ